MLNCVKLCAVLWLTGVGAPVILGKARGSKLINPSLVIASLHLASCYKCFGSVGLKLSALNWIKGSLVFSLLRFFRLLLGLFKEAFSLGSLEHKSQFSSRWQKENQGYLRDRKGMATAHPWGASHSTALFLKQEMFRAVCCLHMHLPSNTVS